MMAGGEIQLPEHIIQHVQYFLTSKEAARTSVLSKSWGSAWLTRPNLDFDQRNFAKRKTCDRFSKFADNTFKRYEDSNLKIESFKLHIDSNVSCDRTLVTKLIVRALSLGSTRLAISHSFVNSDFILPNEVFASENLVELTLSRCEVDHRDVVWRCSRLRSLSLENVRMSYDKVLCLISSCPLIEKLSLCWIDYYFKRGFINADGDPIILPRLRCLVLNVEINTLFFSSLSSSFPSLKDLTLEMKIWYENDLEYVKEVLISSSTLERLHFKTRESDGPRRFKFDVPSLRKFTYSGRSFPAVSFRPTLRAWESRVLITRNKCPSTLWFRKLSKFLTKLRRSRICTIYLRVNSRVSFDYKLGDMQGLPTHVIDNLTVDFHNTPSLSCYAILDGFFLLCRPKLITPHSNVEFIGQTLLHGLNVKFSTPTQLMYGLKDLKEARVQFFDADVSSWRDVSLDAFLEKSKTPEEDKRDVRFHLEWQS